MLARPERYRCIECGMHYGSEEFALHEGRIENGPAYWCDRGLLCSSQCSLAHFLKRREEGTLQQEPAPNPLEADHFRQR